MENLRDKAMVPPTTAVGKSTAASRRRMPLTILWLRTSNTGSARHRATSFECYSTILSRSF
jgi:hypothetical protein